MIMSVVWNIFDIIIKVLKVPLYIILIIIAVFCFLVTIQLCIGFKKGLRFKKGEHINVKRPRFF